MSNQHNTEEQQKTRERIIEATSKVFAEKGYEATTLREISREARVAPGLVHYYFGGKDQLLVEVLDASGRRFHQAAEQLAEHMPADRSLEAFLTLIRTRFDQEPDVYRLRYESFSLGLHNPLLEPKVREQLARRREEIGPVIAKVLDMESTTSASPNPASLAALLLAIFDGLALQKIMDSTLDLDAAYQVLAQMLRCFQRPD
jgi:AcrR family transcriptional regulator